MSLARELLRAMSITGGTQAVNIVLSIARMKALALLLGPAGLGLLSLYNSLQSTASTLAALGIDNSGVRQIAQAKSDDSTLAPVRRVLLVANLVQGTLAMAVIWLLRRPIAEWVFGDPGYALEVGLVGVAVFLSLVAAAHTAFLQGMRRIGDIGRITVLGALAATLGGIAAVWLLGIDGLIWFVLIQPFTTALFATIFARRVPSPGPAPASLREIWQIWKPMAQLGTVFMLGGLLTAATLLLVRTRIVGELGLDAAGHFAAAWGISITYIGFLLSAMGMDFYPRLAETIHDREAAARLMNEQIQIGLAIGGPVLLLLIGLAPVAVAVLYSAEFGEAATLLQWQTVGNLVQLGSWPFGFALAAAARSKSFLAVQLLWNAIFATLVWFGLPLFGLGIAGVAFLTAHLLVLVFTAIAVMRLLDFRWERLSLTALGTHLGLALGLLALALAFPLAGAVAAVALFLSTGFVGGHILLEKIGPGLHTERFARLYAACGWPTGSSQ